MAQAVWQNYHFNWQKLSELVLLLCKRRILLKKILQKFDVVVMGVLPFSPLQKSCCVWHLNPVLRNNVPLSVFQINIDFQTKNMIAQNIQGPTHTCFSAAQKRVYSLMENNSYPRFLESEFYQELCRKTPISRAAQGTWVMDRREKQPVGCRGSRATAREQHPDPKGWGTECSACLPRCKDKHWLCAELMARSDAAGGCSGDVAQRASSCWHCPSLQRWLCRSPSVTAEEQCGRSGQSFLLVSRSCSLHLGTAGNLSNWVPIYFS